MGVRYKVVPSFYHEKDHPMPPAALVMRHAVGKVRCARVPGTVTVPGTFHVLGADTLVYCQGKILGKPKNTAHALKILAMISGRTHHVYTGVALRDLASGKIFKGYEKTKVYVKKLSRPLMREYICKAHSLDKAGAYAIQVRPSIIEKIAGSRSNVIGLPVSLVKKLYRKILKDS